MAHIEPYGDTGNALAELTTGLQGLTLNIDKVAQNCINAASPTMEKIYRTTMSGASSKLGGAARASATTKAKQNFLGDYAVSRSVGWNPGPAGTGGTWTQWEETHRTRYGMIAALFNYGVGSHDILYKKGPNKFGLTAFKANGTLKHPGMPGVSGAQGWHGRAASAAEGPVTRLVEKKFKSEVRRLVKRAAS